MVPCSVDKTKWKSDALETYLKIMYHNQTIQEHPTRFQASSHISEACCKVLRPLFKFENIETIFDIMKFSIGSPLPYTLSEMQMLNNADYKKLVPYDGNLERLEEKG